MKHHEYLKAESLTCGEMCRSDNAWEAVEEVLSHHQETPDTDPPLKTLLPAITACFGAHPSVADTIKALKEKELSDDSSGNRTSPGIKLGREC